MANYRRSALKGGTFFFTVVLADQSSSLLVEQVDLLRDAVRQAKQERPFTIRAWVVLPDHMHCIWTLPQGDADYSTRWRDIKRRFSRALPKMEFVNANQMQRGERGIWQRRFWEHTILSDRDYEAHLHYVHLNPVKHGLVKHVKDWPYSSFHRFVKDGIYPLDWMSDGLS